MCLQENDIVCGYQTYHMKLKSIHLVFLFYFSIGFIKKTENNTKKH